ncbi:MAG: class I SAM-dependent methyltransferase [Desulfobacterales bacterium]|nr:class I SAM-dependent methyltransferase [Desulfobacterales bacterium]
MEFNWKWMCDVKGFLDQTEAETLYNVALKASQRAPCLEIGSYCGKSTVCLAKACQVNQTILFSIDHHRGSEEQQPGEDYFDPELFDYRSMQMDTFPLFRNTLNKHQLEDTVVPIVCKSWVAARAWATPLSLVFIDGGHSYESAFTDYQCWSRHIIPQGYLLIHDIFKDPSQGGQAPYNVYQLALKSGVFQEICLEKTLGVLQRISSNFAYENNNNK